MVVSIHQPSYWPWFGFLDKAKKSDIFVILDNVQLNKDAFQRRNIFLANGNRKFITIPIDYHLGIKINEAIITDTGFTDKHFMILRNWYLKSPYYKEISDLIKPIYSNEYKLLIEVLNQTILVCFDLFNIKAKVITASSLNIEGSKGQLVLNICKELNADKYLSGHAAIDYFNEEDYDGFKNSGIEIQFQDFQHPVYTQFNSKTFESGLSSLDYLFNYGIKAAYSLF